MRLTQKMKIIVFTCVAICSFFISGNAMADTTSNLSAYWPLNNNGQDVSGNYNIATLYGPIGTENRNGYDNFALEFDGTNDYAEVADSNSIDIMDDDFTFSCWVKPDSLGSHIMLDKRDTSNNDEGYCFFLDNGGHLTLRIYGDYIYNNNLYNGTISYYSSTDVLPGVYRHVVVSVDRSSGTGMKFYIDNTLVSTQDPTRNVLSINSAANLFIGKYHGAGYYLNGSLDDLRIYKRALTASDIEELYNETNPNPITYADEIAFDYDNDGDDEIIKLGKSSNGVIITIVYLDGTTNPVTIDTFFSSSMNMTPKTISKATINSDEVIVVTAEDTDSGVTKTQVYTPGATNPFSTPVSLLLYE